MCRSRIRKHNADVIERYGNPTRFGLRALVVLDADGKQLTTQDTGLLEEGDHHDPEKVLAFLEEAQNEDDEGEVWLQAARGIQCHICSQAQTTSRLLRVVKKMAC